MFIYNINIILLYPDRLASGYTRQELYSFNEKLLKFWKPFSKKDAPQWLKLASGFKQKPEVVIQDPSKSYILQVNKYLKVQIIF